MDVAGSAPTPYLRITAEGMYQGQLAEVQMTYYDREHTGASDDLYIVQLIGTGQWLKVRSSAVELLAVLPAEEAEAQRQAALRLLQELREEWQGMRAHGAGHDGHE